MRERKKHLLLVSPPKCGTHLVLKLTQLLGFKNTGDIRQTKMPPLKPGVITALYQHLGRQLPLVFPNPLDAIRYLRAFHRRSLGDLMRTHLKDPTCLVLHTLDCSKAGFLRDWYRTRYPPIVFNFRDPRDQLISFVRYLQPGGKWSIDFAPIPGQIAHADILASLPDENARIMHAIVDETFPFKDALQGSTWLLKNPHVCKVSFERLVGGKGGGSTSAQTEEVAKVMEHLGVAGDPEKIASELFGNSRTFSGNPSNWRDVFTSEHKKAFDQRFGAILDIYGYEREGKSSLKRE
jgi:hypothetical protein